MVTQGFFLDKRGTYIVSSKGMKTEKIVLYFIATLIGLFAAGILFYIYQAAKVIPTAKIEKPIVINTVSPTSSPDSVFLILDEPKDEDVVNKKIITVSGTASKDAIVIILTEGSQTAISPSLNGSFSTTQTLENGENVIEITAVRPNGEEKKITRVVTFSSEDF